MDKAVLFIDGGYLGKLTKNEFKNSSGPRRIDFSKLSMLIAKRCDADLLRTYYYDCPPFVSPNPTPEERKRQQSFDSFLNFLQRLDKFDTRLGKLRKYYNQDGTPSYEQKGVDILLAIDALKLSLKGKITKAIIITGDSDFVPVVRTIKDEGVEVFLFYHQSAVHRDLLNACDTKIVINETLIDECSR